MILSDFLNLRVRRSRRLHTTETTVNLAKPNNHPNSALSPLFSTRARIEGRTTPKWRNVTFLPSEITHFCYRRPMFQIQQHRSASDRLTASFAAKPDFMSCPLIGQSSSWRTAVMSPTRVGYTPMSLSLPHSQWGSGATFSQC